MDQLKAAAAVVNQTPLDWERNKANILASLDAARKQKASVLCLPEMCISGYGCEDAFLSTGLQQTALEVLFEIVPKTEGLITALGVPLLYENDLFNTVCVVADGKVLGFVAKQNLAGQGIHYETRWFKPWKRGHRTETTIQGERYPLGDWIFDCGGVGIGFEICEDAWIEDRPGAILAKRGADLILNPSASHFAFGKHDVRKGFVLEGSRDFHVGYIYANLLGNEAGRAIYDGDAMIASCGEMKAKGKRLSFADHRLVTAMIDLKQIQTDRSPSDASSAAISQAENHCISTDFDFPTIDSDSELCNPAAWESGAQIKEEEFARAVALALFDYLRKSRSKGFVVSLSGGADSSAVAALVGLMVQFGVEELGQDDFLDKLSYIEGLQQASDPKAIVRRLLTTVYQATKNSSQTTRDAARVLADALGAEHLEFDVDAIVESYINLVSDVIERPLSWEKDDIALQNIQARSRAPSVWLLANLRGALLLATSNRSEAAVGYTTMDGDTCGGLSPISGIDKAYLRKWLLWREQEGPQSLEPLAALAAVNQQQPTAELRPPAAGQTDEDDLMPYEVLDAIERLAIRDKMNPLELFQSLRRNPPQNTTGQPPYTIEQLHGWIERFFKLWCRNQWKRERYAPSFHLDDENLDPKTWCRFPILSGGFERELAELEIYIRRLAD